MSKEFSFFIDRPGDDSTLFKICVDQEDSHVHFRLFAGKTEGSLGLCGMLCMRKNEFESFLLWMRARGKEKRSPR